MTVPTGELGYTDANVAEMFGGLVEAVLEHVPTLQWPRAIPVYAQMRTDPKLGQVLKAYTLPIRKAQWAVDGTGCDAKITQLIADDLGLAILNKEDKPTGYRRRGVDWNEHLRLALLSLTFGHMPFEKEFQDDGTEDGMTHLVGLHERMPTTLTEIHVDRRGDLDYVKQAAQVNVQGQYDGIKLNRNRLLWYSNDREGANWPGISMLRNSYGPWLIKHEMWRVLATSHRRFGMGVPVVEAPPGATPQQVAEAARLSQSVRVGDKGGMGLPPGFKYTLAGLTGSLPNTLEFVQYLDMQMSSSALTNVLDLGDTATGSRALGVTFMDLLLEALQATAENIAATLTREVCVPLVDYNLGENEPVPRVVVSSVGAKRDVTAETLKLLADAGVLGADSALKEYVRKEWHLPEVVEEEQGPTPSEAAQVLQEQAPPPPATAQATPSFAKQVQDIKDTKLPAASRLPFGRSTLAAPARDSEGNFRRLPTPDEVAAATDYERLDEQYESLLELLIEDWGDIAADQQGELLKQVEDIVGSGDLSRLATLTVNSTAATELLTEYMMAMAGTSAAEMAAEAGRQGVSVKPGVPDAEKIGQVAVALSEMQAGGLAAFVGRTTLQVYQPNGSTAEIKVKIKAKLDELTDTSLRDNLGSGLTAAQNEGRMATLRKAPPARYFASEIMDAGTCKECVAVDGHEYQTLGDAEDAYANGGYDGCLGGLRCRGIVVTRWEE
jgi:hypothetical protein